LFLYFVEFNGSKKKWNRRFVGHGSKRVVVPGVSLSGNQSGQLVAF